MKTSQQAKRVHTTLRELRCYRDDLDEAIAAFTLYAAMHERRATIIEIRPQDRNISDDRYLTN